MLQEIHRICAGINCYLIRGREGFALIDTGPAMARRRLLRGLERTGCGEEDLRLIVLTHGDVDHIGSAVQLREMFGAQIAAHQIEARALESAGRQSNRKEKPDLTPWFFKALMPLGRLFGGVDPLALDLILEDEQSLSPFGIDATVLHLPGHSGGSIGVLTEDGDLFCGDLFWNMRRPRLHPLIDDLEDARASIQKLRGLPIKTIHPAHGKPFPATQMASV